MNKYLHYINKVPYICLVIKKLNKIDMGKVILEFDSVEEQDDIKSALDGYKWKLAMCDLDQELRKTTRYNQSLIKTDGTESCDVEDLVAEKYRDLLREILSGYGLLLD